jgi:hypothetical protein
MAGIVGLIKSKPLKPIIPAVVNNPYAIALEFPDESDRLFDGDLKLLLMDGLSNPPILQFPLEFFDRLRL